MTIESSLLYDVDVYYYKILLSEASTNKSICFLTQALFLRSRSISFHLARLGCVAMATVISFHFEFQISQGIVRMKDTSIVMVQAVYDTFDIIPLATADTLLADVRFVFIGK